MQQLVERGGFRELAVRVVVEAPDASCADALNWKYSNVLPPAGSRMIDLCSACLNKATEIAQSQNSKMCKVRAITDLAHLWHLHGKRNEAHAPPKPLYDWFREGFDTAVPD